MTFLHFFSRCSKTLILFSLIIAIGIPLWYGSTNYQYLRLRLSHSFLSIKYSFIPDHNRPTLSDDYRAFEEILITTPLAELDPTADIFTIIKSLRSQFTMGTTVPKPAGCQIDREEFEHNGHIVETYWINNHQNMFEKNSDKLLIYIHGGGYMLGDIHGYAGFECHLSRLFNVTLLHLEYRLCPEHPLPAGVDDAIALYRALIDQKISSSQIMIMGDSAGGGLALLTIQALIKHQLPIPRGVIVLSPWTDLSASGESYKRNRAIDIMFRNTGEDDGMVKLMLGPNPSGLLANDSLFSPLFGSFEGFPPMYITVGTAEILQDDARGVLKRGEQAGINVTFEEGLHLMHIYPIFYPYYPEARQTLDRIRTWIESNFKKDICHS